MKPLTSAERRELRARAHALHPLVMIGAAGLTPAVLREIDLALKNHELIKVRMLGDDRDRREVALEQISSALDAHPVQIIGKILVVFRPAPEPPPEAAEKGKARKKGNPGKSEASKRRPRRR